MVNVLNGKSNGEEKDKAWAWKDDAELKDALKSTDPERELRDLEHELVPSAGKASVGKSVASRSKL